MKAKTLVSCILLCALSGFAFAVPPRPMPPNKPAAKPTPRPQVSPGAPSLSQAARPARPQPQPARPQPQPTRPQTQPTRPQPQPTRPQPQPGRPTGSGGMALGGPNRPPTRPPASVLPTNPGRPLPNTISRPDRTTINRPSVVINRPDVNINRPTVIRNDIDVNRVTVNRPTINNTTINNNVINQTNINKTVVNKTNVVNQNVVNQNVVNVNRPPVYRPAAQPYSNYSYRPNYYSQLHYHWQPNVWGGNYRPAYYNNSYRVVSGGFISSSVSGVTYVNPFFARPSSTTVQYYDYSQPLAVPEPTYRETDQDLIRSERAMVYFDQARVAFRGGDYRRANELVDDAIRQLPNDPTLHQFRALVLFSTARYNASAAAIYSVLAVSPGWDGETIGKLYGSPMDYLSQVETLKQFVVEHPRSVDAQFLLAYHLILTGEFDQARVLLQGVAEANPNDRIVQNLLAAMES